ncbi:hypothetical protein [Streptomyces sp. NPDC050287]|uniref:hypothetical protein n=1 Tax=Streptomyces sp. NPDC050287 TaxID=3365608 RepID=UPI00378AB88C
MISQALASDSVRKDAFPVSGQRGKTIISPIFPSEAIPFTFLFSRRTESMLHQEENLHQAGDTLTNEDPAKFIRTAHKMGLM